MEPYQQRVIAELADLSERIEKLRSFLDTDTYKELSTHEKDLMYLQFNIMVTYATVLYARINLFSE